MTIECIFSVYCMDFIYEIMWVLKLLMTHLELVLGLRFLRISKTCTSTLMEIPEITLRRPAEFYKLIFFELVNNLITFGT